MFTAHTLKEARKELIPRIIDKVDALILKNEENDVHFARYHFKTGETAVVHNVIANLESRGFAVNHCQGSDWRESWNYIDITWE